MTGSRSTGAIASGLPAMDVAGRARQLRERFDEVGIDALFVTHLTNIRYLTGFTGSAGLLAVTPDELILVTDGRYQDQAPAQLAAAGVDARVEVSSESQRKLVGAALGGFDRVGLEAEHVSWAAHGRYDEDWFPGAELVATGGLVEDIRAVKDPGEVARIRAACSIADQALSEVLPQLLDRPTELDFARELDHRMRLLGAADTSFETIVASGPNGARPHHRPTGRMIVDGDLVVVDFGALVDGYCSDMTRTFMVGEPTAPQQRMLDVVTAAQAAGVAAVAAGVAASVVDAACRAVIEEAGWGNAFTHGTGHGVGLDIHEAPRVGRTSTATLASGHIVTVEPGVYLEQHGGVRVEDTVVVTESGAEPLTRAPKLTAVA